MKIIIFISVLFIGSYTYGLGYLETLGSMAIQGQNNNNQAGYLNNTKNNALCNIRYNEEQQRYRDCLLQSAVSSSAGECVKPSPPNCN